MDELREVKKAFHKRPLLLAVTAGVLLAGVILGVRHYLYAISHESTDNAFIEGHIIPISAKVAGHVTKVYVTDNQEVKQGDLLLEIDPRDFEARLAEARAALQAARAREKAARVNVELTRVTSSAGVERASSAVDMTKAGVAAAHRQLEQARAQVKAAASGVEEARAQLAAFEAEAVRSEADLKRYQQLYERDEVSRQQLDYAIAAAHTAKARLEAARKRVTAVEAQLQEAQAAENRAADALRQAEAAVGEALGRLAEANSAPQQVSLRSAEAEIASAEIERAQAAVMQSELQLSYTKVYAPESGRVTRKSVEVGQFLQIGQPLMAIVPRRVWVTANFKETQLTSMQSGQPAKIRVDAYPGKVFKGHVDSIQAGSGARFSLLPPENATGNYVKVVQRVPVKILFDEDPDPHYHLGPGMSVVPEVKVRDYHFDALSVAALVALAGALISVPVLMAIFKARNARPTSDSGSDK